MMIDYHFGLLGWPLGHSLSVPIHQAALDALGLSGEYNLFPYEPSRKVFTQLQFKLDEVKNGALHGLNVTIPYKQTIISWLDGLTPIAKAIGAVNTIYLENKKLIGDNTDAPGFFSDLQTSPIAETLSKPDGSILILGAGGAARAIIYSLMNFKKPILIAARRLEQAVELAAYINQLKRSGTPRIMPLSLSKVDISRAISTFPPVKLIVNATPVGMTPKINESPWPVHLPLPPTAAVYDLIYNPQETSLLKYARCENLLVRNGLGMLVEQAALAFERWTNFSHPREPMYNAAVSSMRFMN